MKKILIPALILLSFSLFNALADDGLTTYKGLCGGCHVLVPPPTIAPPFYGVKRNLMRTLPEREAFVNFVIEYVHKPDAAKSRMPDAVQRFKLMPALPYPEDKVRAVAEFIYDTDLFSVE